MHRIIVYLVPCDLGGTCMLQILTQQLVLYFVFLAINIGIVFGHLLKYRIAPDVQGPKFYTRRPASLISLLYPRHVAIFS